MGHQPCATWICEAWAVVGDGPLPVEALLRVTGHCVVSVREANWERVRTKKRRPAFEGHVKRGCRLSPLSLQPSSKGNRKKSNHCTCAFVEAVQIPVFGKAANRRHLNGRKLMMLAVFGPSLGTPNKIA